MLVLYYAKFILNITENTRILFNKLISKKEKINEYYLKLDGYYFCKKKMCTIAVIRIRNKRTVDKIAILDIINDRNYLKELHPLDACIIGILANNESNGIIDKNTIGWKKMHRSRNYRCFIKSDPILKISGKYVDENDTEIIMLYSKVLDKEIEITTVDLAKNQALLYSLDSLEAISIGYNISEQYVKKHMRLV